MPLFMDIHTLPGVKAQDVATAHQLDVFHQHEYQCKCMTYWIDEERENVFCLIDAPDKDAVDALHRKTHGLIPNKIIEVNGELVKAFLGRIYDPGHAVKDSSGLLVFADSSFRILLQVAMTDPVLLLHEFGAEKGKERMELFYDLVRTHLKLYEGREVEHRGSGFITSFTSARQALNCAFAIHNAVSVGGKILPAFRIGISSGEPVSSNDELFGDTLKVTGYLCSIAKPNQVLVTAGVVDLSKDFAAKKSDGFVVLSPQDEMVLQQLFEKLQEKWQEPDFDMTEYCLSVTMSKSQLYRKAISLTGLSPNALLKEFRLNKAKDMLGQQRHSISQITFEAGFSSPSYFTKCFKKQFGLLPMEYLELLHQLS